MCSIERSVAGEHFHRFGWWQCHIRWDHAIAIYILYWHTNTQMNAIAFRFQDCMPICHRWMCFFPIKQTKRMLWKRFIRFVDWLIDTVVIADYAHQISTLVSIKCSNFFSNWKLVILFMGKSKVHSQEAVWYDCFAHNRQISIFSMMLKRG